MTINWPVKALGNVCHVVGGGTPPKDMEHYFRGTIPWATVRDMRKDVISETEFQITEEAVGASSTNIIPAHNVVIATRVGLGKVCFVERDTAINQDLRGIIPMRKSELSVHYLFWWLKSIAHLIVQEGTGATVQGVKLQFIKSLEIPVPPLPEQKRIVAILDEAFAGIATATANAEKNLANANELFESTLSSVLATNSEEWPERKLEEIVEATCTLSYGIVQPGEEVADGLPIVRPTDLYRHLIELNGLKRIDPALAEGYSRTKLVGDELLLCVRGSTGVISIASSELTGGNVTRGIVPVRFSPSFVSQKLGYYLFLSKSVQDQIRSATYGTALMQINIRDLRRLSFIVPPLDDQPGLLRELESVSRNVQCLKQLYEQKLTVLAELKQSILQKAFSGELTTLPHHALQHAAE